MSATESGLPTEWDVLWRTVNDRPPRIGDVGVRDPASPCELFDGKGYDGRGDCMSDGHYVCAECSHLSPEAPRFVEHDGGRRDRLVLWWSVNSWRKYGVTTEKGQER